MPRQGALKPCKARAGGGGGPSRGLAPRPPLLAAAAALAVLVALWGAAPGAADAAAGSASHPYLTSWGHSGLDPGHFVNPQSAAVDGEGNVYVTDLGNARVQKFDSDGVYLLSWGDSGLGPGQFRAPAGIAVGHNSTVYVVDAQQNRVQAFGPDGLYIGQWGERGQGPGKFILPSGIAAGPDGHVYVADTGNRRVQEFTANGTYVSEIGRLGVPEGDALASPSGIAVGASGTVYVSDPAAASIKRFGPGGEPLAAYDSSVGGMDLRAHGVDVAPGGGLYAADPINNRIVLLDASGAAAASWGSEGIQAGQFKLPEDVAVSSAAGLLYVVDSNGHRVQAFSLPPPPPRDDPAPQQAPQQPQRQREAPPAASAAAGGGNGAAGGADLSKPSIVPPADMTVEATGPLTPVSVGQAVATDASGIESLESNAPERFTLGISTVIWTAIDGAGNMAVATQKVTVRDTIPPSIGAVPDARAEASGAAGTAVELAEPHVADAVGVMSVSSDAPALFPLGATAVTWTARDVAGNEATALQSVVVEDTVRPSVRAPPDVVFEAASAGSNEVPLGEAAASDSGSGVASVASDAPALFPIGTTVVTWTATDAAGNEATDAQDVAVVDTTPPSIAPPPDVVFEAASPAPSEVELGAPAVDDVQDVAVSSDAPALFPLGSHTVVWNATDASGNSAAASQRVDVVDTTPPSVRVPPPATVEAESPEGAAAALGRIAVGEAAGAGAAADATPIASVANDAPPVLPLGRTIVTWTVSDEAGNTATAEQEIVVVDTTPPSISAPDDVAAEAASPDGTPVELGEAAATDAVGVASVSSDAPALFPLGTTTVTWTATDAAGNEATDAQEVAVVDTTPPSISAPDDVAAEAASPDGTPVELGEAAATDAVGVASVSSDAPALFPLGTTIVTWTARDMAGNEATARQQVAVLDSTPPLLVAPPDVEAEATGPGTALADIGSATATDAVGVALLGSDAPAAYPVGSTVVTWTAADAAGNAAQARQTVAIVDTTPPSIAAPPDAEFEARAADANAVDIGAPEASDKVGVASVASDAPGAFAVGSTVVTWTAADAAGNTASDSHVVSIVDTTPPSVYAPESVLAEAAGPSGTAVDHGSATASDAVGVVSVASDAPALFPLGTTIVTWTAADAAGNSQAATQEVTVVDTTAPALTAPANATAEAASPDGAPVDTGSPIATDAVGVASVASDAPALFPLGTTIVTWTARDMAGNEATARQQVVVRDTAPPAITVPPPIVLEAAGPGGYPVGPGSLFDLPTAVDLAGPAALESDAPPVLPLGTTTLTWTATDSAGNAATAEQQITVRDTVPPVLEPPADIAAEAASPDGTPVDIVPPNATDTVGVASVASDAPALFPLGTTIVTWTARDMAGNEATARQQVVVRDTTPPTIDDPPALSLEAGSAAGYDTAAPGQAIAPPAAADAAGQATVSGDAPAALPLGRTVITWTATDEAGNSAAAEQAVDVADTTPPVLEPPADIIAAEASSPDGTPVDIGEAAATDAVGVASVASDAPALFPLGTTIVSWTAVDDANNTAAAEQRITVRDTTPPAITVPPPIVLEAAGPGGYPVGPGSLFDLPTAVDLAGPASLESDAPPVLPLGTTTLTWTATDSAGNAATAEQQITVRDTVPPVLEPPADIAAEAASPDGTPVDIVPPNATDTVGVASIASDAPPLFPLGTTIVTWTARDMAGNEATARQQVVVRDTTPPTIDDPPALSLEAGSAAGYDTAAPGQAIAPPAAADAAGQATVSGDAPAALPLGRTVITWTATDEAGNSAAAEQAVDVADTTPPVLEPPADIIAAEASSPDGTPVDIGEAAATDAVGVASVASDAPALFPLGTTIVNWTAVDDANNTAAAEQRITVRDTTPPAITVPPPIVLEAAGPGGYPVGPGSLFDLPTAVDLAGPASLESDAPPVLPLGTTTLTWTATDSAGNAAAAEQEITVRDTIPPVLEPPADIAAEAASPDGTPVDIVPPNATDTVGVASVASDAPPLFPLGTTIVTWTARDMAGNEAASSHSVSVLACGRPPAGFNVVTGTDGDDILAGTPGPDLIFALAGDDVILAGGGDDCILAGAGDDVIRGQSGDDVIRGQSGDDVIDGGPGSDACEQGGSGGLATNCEQ